MGEIEFALKVIGAGTAAIILIWCVIGLIKGLIWLLSWRGTIRHLLIGNWKPGPEFHSWPGNRWWWR